MSGDAKRHRFGQSPKLRRCGAGFIDARICVRGPGFARTAAVGNGCNRQSWKGTYIMNAYDITQNPEGTKKELRRISNRNSLMLIGIIAVLNVLGAVLLSLKFNEDITMMLSLGLQFLVVFPIAAILRNLDSRTDTGDKPRNVFVTLTSYFRKPEQPLPYILKWTVICMGLCYLANIISMLFFLLLESLTGRHLSDTLQSVLAGSDSTAQRVFVFISVAVLAPVFEELLFRGVLLNRTLKYGGWLAVFMSGLMFAMFHMNYSQLLYAFVLGVVFGYIALKTKSILPVIFAHFFVNLFGALQSVFMSQLPPGQLEAAFSNETAAMLESNPSAFMPMLIIGSIQLAVSVGGLFLFIFEVPIKKNFRIDNPCPQISSGKKVLTYLTAPATVVAIVLLVVMTLINAGVFVIAN
ncbi:MAG: CPBP family intramembrane metalloprotease [Oscillospiraceae bacterium]|jgi:membrane protease YdiL (CAAX protease family)|nr:CPBP family intramembrane metalloprotease [Oscillospiraceae bacterium]